MRTRLLPKAASISNDLISRIKKDLWEKVPQGEISRKYGVSQPTVSRIRRGTVGTFVPWPTGDIGGMPKQSGVRKQGINESAWSASSMRYLNFPEDMRESILIAVNARRRKLNIDEIPRESEELTNYLSAPPGTRAQEHMLSDEAFQAEDLRMSTLMLEFDDLVSQQSQADREERLLKIIQGTRRDPSEDKSPDNDGDLEYNKLPWNEVLSRAGSLPLVRRVLAKRDPVLLEATCIAFASSVSWHDPAIEKHIEDIRKLLESYPKAALRIRKENIKFFPSS